MRVLGLSFSGHGSSGCLVEDGRIVRALNLERITRRKFSLVALPGYVDFLREVTVRFYRGEPASYFDFYEVFPAMLEYLAGSRSLADAGLDLAVKARDNIGPVEGPGEDSPLRTEYARFLDYFAGVRTEFELEHHLAHAYQAYLCSPFEEAAIITMDGSGEALPRLGGDYISTTFAVGRDLAVEVLDEICFPHSVGGLYSSFTRQLGFRENQEGNTMALAAFGGPDFYREARDDWSLGEEGRYRFAFGPTWKTLRILDRMEEMVPRRSPAEELSAPYRDLAWAVQRITEEILVHAARAVRRRTGLRCLALAGGVGLNCVANARVLAESGFDELYVMPNAGDRGLAAGAALYGQHVLLGGRRRQPPPGDDLGRPYGDAAIVEALAAARDVRSRQSLDVAGEVASLLAAGRIIGWFQGAAEFGPRALGHRSILADPRTLESKRRLDRDIKRREWFRPYAPSVLAERAADYFVGAHRSPYMLLALPVRSEAADRIRGVVHADGTARIQTVDRDLEPLYHRLISAFAARTGIPMVLNTSFNSNGAPMVETPRDAVDALVAMKLDVLAIGDRLAWREGGPAP